MKEGCGGNKDLQKKIWVRSTIFKQGDTWFALKVRGGGGSEIEEETTTREKGGGHGIETQG